MVIPLFSKEQKVNFVLIIRTVACVQTKAQLTPRAHACFQKRKRIPIPTPRLSQFPTNIGVAINPQMIRGGAMTLEFRTPKHLPPNKPITNNNFDTIAELRLYEVSC